MPSSIQSALHASGIQAARSEQLWWLMFWVCASVFFLVMTALAIAITRGRSGASFGTPNRTISRSISIATALSIISLLGLLLADAMTGRALASLASPGALGIRITGYQWWWSVEYLDSDPSLSVTTANEIHLPVGRPIYLMLKAADVIHSFWAPPLHGKTDLIPGRENVMWLRADSPGIYRGQCAEYCGVQHAHMAVTVIAESPEQFDQWVRPQDMVGVRP